MQLGNNNKMLTTTLLLSLIAYAAAHAALMTPATRAMHGKPIEGYDVGCSGESCPGYQVGCMVGCDECSLQGKEMWPTPQRVSCKINGTAVPAGKTPFPVPRTVPKWARSWNLETKSPAGDFTKYMPWTSPGASAVADEGGVLV